MDSRKAASPTGETDTFTWVDSRFWLESGAQKDLPAATVVTNDPPSPLESHPLSQSKPDSAKKVEQQSDDEDEARFFLVDVVFLDLDLLVRAAFRFLVVAAFFFGLDLVVVVFFFVF